MVLKPAASEYLLEMQHLRPVPDLLSQILHFNKVSRRFLCLCELGKHLFRLGTMVPENNFGNCCLFVCLFPGPDSFYLREEALAHVLSLWYLYR